MQFPCALKSEVNVEICCFLDAVVSNPVKTKADINETAVLFVERLPNSVTTTYEEKDSHFEAFIPSHELKVYILSY